MKFRRVIAFILTGLLLAGCDTNKNEGNKPKQLFVSFLDYDYSLLWQTKVNRGDVVDYYGPTPTREMDQQYVYSFKGWQEDINVAITDNTVFHAVYSKEVRQFTVKFINYDNSIIWQTSVKYGEHVNYLGSTPIRTSDDSHYSYTFSGWDRSLSETAIYKDESFYAQYSTTQYVFTSFYNYDNTLIQKSKILYGGKASYTSSTPTRQYSGSDKKKYKFTGWDKSLDENLYSDTVFHAQFQLLNVYTVQFNNYDNTFLKTVDVLAGDTAVYNGLAPTRPSTTSGNYIYTYKFTGWDKSLENVQSSFTTTAVYSSSSTYYNATYQNALAKFRNYCTNYDSDGVYRNSFYISSGSMYNAMYACYDPSSDVCFLEYLMQSGTTSRTKVHVYLPKTTPGKYDIYYAYYYGSLSASGLSFSGYSSISSSFSSSSTISFTNYSNYGTTSVSTNASLCSSMVDTVLTKASTKTFFDSYGLGFYYY